MSDNTHNNSETYSGSTFTNLNEIKTGYEVYGMDNQTFGTVEKVLSDGIQVNGQRIATAAIARVENKRVYLQVAGADYLKDGVLRVPIIEERLTVGKRTVEAGAAEIRKTVTSEEQTVPIDLMREKSASRPTN